MAHTEIWAYLHSLGTRTIVQGGLCIILSTLMYAMGNHCSGESVRES